MSLLVSFVPVAANKHTPALLLHADSYSTAWSLTKWLEHDQNVECNKAILLRRRETECLDRLPSFPKLFGACWLDICSTVLLPCGWPCRAISLCTVYETSFHSTLVGWFPTIANPLLCASSRSIWNSLIYLKMVILERTKEKHILHSSVKMHLVQLSKCLCVALWNIITSDCTTAYLCWINILSLYQPLCNQ